MFGIKDEVQQKEKILIFNIIKGKFFLIKGNRKNKCEICGKYFKEKGNLLTHKKIHAGIRPFKCNFQNCRKSFITLGNLKAHLDHHNGKKPFVCAYPGCRHRYSRQNRLEIHARTHTGQRPYKCPFGDCDKSFNEKGNLKTHYRIHTGERPFKCAFMGCKKSFKAHSHLKDHEKTHSRVKPYTCKICFKSYGRSGILKTHLRTHKLNPEEISMLTSRIEEEREQNEISHYQTENNYVEDSKPQLTLVNLKFLDENVTITNSSNPEERTPATIGNMKNYNTIHINSLENSQKEEINKLSLNLLKVPKVEGPETGKSQTKPEFNFLTPKNVSHHGTPTNKTPLSKVESNITKYINSGQDNINFEEATKLYNNFTNYLSQYFQNYSNEVKYTNFNQMFQEYLLKSVIENQNLSLTKLLQILQNQNDEISSNVKKMNADFTTMSNSFNNSNNISNLNNFFNLTSHTANNPVSPFSNLQLLGKGNQTNKFNNNFFPHSPLNNANMAGFSNPNLLFDTSPFLNLNALSPIFNTNYYGNPQNSFDNTKKNLGSSAPQPNSSGNAKNDVRQDYTFSDYWNLFQYKN